MDTWRADHAVESPTHTKATKDHTAAAGTSNTNAAKSPAAKDSNTHTAAHTSNTTSAKAYATPTKAATPNDTGA